ncbi:MAG: phosphatidylinositol kinase [Epsilonproteobacteria bacterium]|nr:MAG: phosphatidylinositol kinase [Campylobacterota bacterium]
MKIGRVYSNDLFVGILYRAEESVVFVYADSFVAHPQSYDISINLPRSKKQFTSPYLHPFFSNMLSEGSLRKIQCRKLGLDEEDDFMVLLYTTQYDVIGAIRVIPDEIDELSEVADEMS